MTENLVLVPVRPPYTTTVIDGVTYVMMQPEVLRKALSSLAAEAEPVAQTERVKLYRKIMGMIADKQRYAGVMISGRDLHVIAKALLDRAIEVERSSPVSAEVTEAAAKRVCLATGLDWDYLPETADNDGTEDREWFRMLARAALSLTKEGEKP